MQEIKEQPTIASEATDGLAAAALRAEAWAGEPFLREGEDPAHALAPGTSRRRALDDALAEIDAGERVPSSQWKVRYALMLGLERVLAEQPPHLASGTELRRHQVDALAGMLTELIAANEKGANGNGTARPRRPHRRTTTRTSSSSSRTPTRSFPSRCRSRRIRARFAATGSAI